MDYDILIIGAGPGGYEMAAAAAQNGLSAAVVERAELGGTCLNRGCIPTKALCRNAQVLRMVREGEAFGVSVGDVAFNYAAAFERKGQVVRQLRDGVKMLLSQPGVTVIEGEAAFCDAHTVAVNGKELTAANIVIATGSQPKGLPIAGAELAMTSDDILAMDVLPRSLCIIGGGVIGMEFAGIFSAFGVEVTVVEFCKEILPPFDKDVAKRLRTTMSKRGVNINVGSEVKSIATASDGLTVTWNAKGKEASVTCERVLMAVGRQPVLPRGLEKAGVAVGRRGIEVDQHMLTTAPAIYAIGDVNARCMLAHAASAQGMVALSHILHKPSCVNLAVVPSAVFTEPELAMAGVTEEQCKQQGVNYVAKKALFRANGKALAMGEADGLVKMIVDADTRRILGCHICGPHAADLIQEVVTVMAANQPVDLLKQAIHGHPTLGETVAAAARQF